MNNKKIISSFINPYFISTLVVLFIILTFVFFNTIKYSHENSKDLGQKRALEIIEKLKKIRNYYTQNIISKIKDDIHTNNINPNHKLKDSSFLPITFLHDLNSLIIFKDDIKIKLYSNFPFENRKDRVLNKFEENSLRFLIQNPDKIYSQEVFENNEKRFNIAVADIFYDNSCVSCHNSRVDSPKKDWQVGDVRGAVSVSVPLRKELVLSIGQAVTLLIMLVIIIFILGFHYSITSLKRQREHKKIKNQLENLVQERTSTLQNTVKLLNEYKNAVDISTIVSKTDKNGKITYVNDEFIKVSKYSKEELIGKNHNVVRHEDMPKEIFKDLWKTIHSKKVWKGQIKNRAKDGTAYYVASTIVPILDINDEIEEFLAIRLDVSDIVKSQIKAQKADKAKSSFLANMSHEIRTPLNAIIGFSELLSKADLNIQNRKQAEIIHSSAESLLIIINDILDISKIESGNFELAKESTDLFSISQSVVDLFSRRANEKHIKLIFNIDNKIPLCVKTDEIRVRQVLLNLLSNAIKFTLSKGVISFSVTLLSYVGGKAKIRFEIEDNGIGIPKEKIATIFNPFIQIDHKSNKEYQGTGLGLSICKHIIESLGSKIEVESSVGNGTKFWFDLKLESCEELIINKDKNFTNSLNFKVDDLYSDNFHNLEKYLTLFGTINDNNNDTDIVIYTFNKNDKLLLDSIRKKYSKYPLLILLDDEKDIEGIKERANEEFIALPFYPSKLNDSLQKLLRKTKKNRFTEKTVQTENSDINNAKVLVAEDNPANQELIKYMLDALDVDYVIKGNGEEALASFKEEKFDILLTDINMPIMNGIEIFKQIRLYEKVNNLETLPIVAVTANAIKGDKERLLKLGMNGYLSKPINIYELKSILESLLKNKTFKKSKDIKVEKSEKLFDIDKIVKKLGVNEKIANLIIKKFKDEIFKDLEELEFFISKADSSSIKQKAHYIKSSCLNVALDDAADILNELEDESLQNEEKVEKFEALSKILKEFK